MFEVILSGRARSGVAEARGSLILERNFAPLFKLRLANKDLELALETAHALNVPMPALAAVKQVFAGCMAAGQGDEDICSLIKYLERGMGVEVVAGTRRGGEA
jgi:2-hydroxy-3-oxopropionate reductase